jgi:hypothetical protein
MQTTPLDACMQNVENGVGWNILITKQHEYEKLT